LNHHAAPSYWAHFNTLPAEIQQLARDNFELLVADPYHPSLHLKRVGRYWSVRVGLNYRAVGDPTNDGILWTWIGPHDEYDRIRRRRR